MGYRWSDEKTTLFLELYKNYPCLWDNTSDTYHKVHIREKAYNNFLQELNLPNLTIPDIKAKIKTIRTRYCSELAKIRKSDRSGAGADDIYVPRLMWFKEADSFLRAVCTPKSSTSNMKNLLTETNDITTQSLEREQEENEFEESQIAEDQDEQYTEQLSNTSENAVRSSSTTAISSLPVAKQPKKRKSMDAINDALNKLKKISDDNTKVNKLHEFDVFCNSLAIQLKKMPLRRALICQERLQAVMTQERLSSLLTADASAVTPGPITPSMLSDHSSTSYDGEENVLSEAIYNLGGLTNNY
ncbi:hypothetical protein RI129_002865 [Pyrocoelia pectoralis]|uniref:MADF domain-containing protein n=1 Tax=Pyrocoelia pectoralis TaxID=417401 RepID=A0AAN7VNT9_9COLE